MGVVDPGRCPGDPATSVESGRGRRACGRGWEWWRARDASRLANDLANGHKSGSAPYLELYVLILA